MALGSKETRVSCIKVQDRFDRSLPLTSDGRKHAKALLVGVEAVSEEPLDRGTKEPWNSRERGVE